MPFKSQQRGNIEAYPLKNGLGLYLSGYRYAATLNKGYQQIDEAFGRQLGDLEGKRAAAGLETANAVTDWLKGLDLGEKLKGAWEHQGEALKSYGDAMKRRDEKTADTAKKAWDRHQTNATTLANARAAQTKAQTEGIREIANSEIVRSVMDHYGESMKSYGTAMSEQDEYVKEGLYLSGKHSGVTGSDQTGASIHGYREDTRYKEPGDEWTDGERRLYEFHLKNDPEEAEEYAIRTNDRYNQRKKNEKIQAIDNWMSQNGGNGAAAWLGARGVNQVRGLDSYNKMLEYAAIGRNNVSQNLSASDLVESIDDVNERNISDRYGEEAGAAYRVGTDATDAIISRGVNYLTVAKLPKGDEIRLNDVAEAINAFNESYLSAQNSGLSDFESVGFGVGNVLLDASVGKGLNKLSKETLDENDFARVFLEEPLNAVANNIEIPGSKKWFEEKDSEIQARKERYMKERSVSERSAWWMATKELLQESMSGKNHP